MSPRNDTSLYAGASQALALLYTPSAAPDWLATEPTKYDAIPDELIPKSRKKRSLQEEPSQSAPSNAPPPKGAKASQPGEDDDEGAKLCRYRLQQHAKAAMQIEFTTIPLYLYATWSIKQDNGGAGTKARYAILGVVQQEMLHLSLAGNLMRALKGDVYLYDEAFMPKYNEQTKLLYDRIDLNLEPAKKPLLETFVKIESPWKKPNDALKKEPVPPDAQGAGDSGDTTNESEDDIAKEYRSIGQFYDEFQNGLRAVLMKYPHLLQNNKNQQFSSDDAFGDDMVIIQGLKTATTAMTTIVDQGEGAIGTEDSHYNVFLGLFSNRDAWDCWPIVTNPTTKGYKAHSEYIFRLSRAFDAMYCYLIAIIDAVWHDNWDFTNTEQLIERQYLIRNMHPIMMDLLTPLGDIIVQQPFGTDGKNAGPCFNFYGKLELADADTGTNSRCSMTELYGAIMKELKAALATKDGQAGGMKAKLEAILFTSTKIPPTPNPVPMHPVPTA